jgi:hypothetical protein
MCNLSQDYNLKKLLAIKKTRIRLNIYIWVFFVGYREYAPIKPLSRIWQKKKKKTLTGETDNAVFLPPRNSLLPDFSIFFFNFCLKSPGILY